SIFARSDSLNSACDCTETVGISRTRDSIWLPTRATESSSTASTATELSNRGNPASSVVAKLTNPSLMTLESSYTPRTCTSIGPVGKRRFRVSPTDAPNDVADDCDSAISLEPTFSDSESIGIEYIAVKSL